jgi:hypothetical protein
MYYDMAHLKHVSKNWRHASILRTTRSIEKNHWFFRPKKGTFLDDNGTLSLLAYYKHDI